MITLLKIILLVLLFMFLIAVFRIGFGVYKFLRLVKRAGRTSSGSDQGGSKRERSGTRRSSGDSRTIELDKDDYKVE
jgi:hypothetical protein